MKRTGYAVVLSVLVVAVWCGGVGRSGGQGQEGGSQHAVCGDLNGSGGKPDISDAVYLLNWLFLGGAEPQCLAACNPPLGDVCDEINDLKQQIAELKTLTRDMSIVEDDPRVPGKTIRFTGVNVQIINGLGRTESRNGLGNLIVGYQELRSSLPPEEEHEPDERTGSHEVVIGQYHNYSAQAGLVVGSENWISGGGDACIGGTRNKTEGSHSAVIGGGGNVTSGSGSVIVAGANNTTGLNEEGQGEGGGGSVVVGGVGNRATGNWAVQCGGNNREVQSNSVCQAGSCPPCAP